jgi:hypothetical protein
MTDISNSDAETQGITLPPDYLPDEVVVDGTQPSWSPGDLPFRGLLADPAPVSEPGAAEATAGVQPEARPSDGSKPRRRIQRWLHVGRRTQSVVVDEPLARPELAKNHTDDHDRLPFTNYDRNLALWRLWHIVELPLVLVLCLGEILGVAQIRTLKAQVETSHSNFPVSLAEAFAVSFVHDYLNLDPRAQDNRSALLSAYSASNDDAAMAWSGVGSMTASEPMVVRFIQTGRLHAMVEVQTYLDQMRWNYVDVPVVFHHHAPELDLDNNAPKFIPSRLAPKPALVPANFIEDPDLEVQLQPDIENFFTAWGENDDVTIRRYTGGRPLPGLEDPKKFKSLALTVGTGYSRRLAVAEVTWKFGTHPVELTQRYILRLAKNGASWDIVAIS